MSSSLMITGSSGLIGSALIKKLSPHFKIFALDQKSSREPLPPNVFFHEMDLTKEESVERAIEFIGKNEIDASLPCVIHLAAYYDFSGEPSDLYEQITVQGTRRLLNALKKMSRVEQFIFSSTQLVHAPCQVGEKINEDWPLDPKWDYPQSKVRTEELLKKEHGDTRLLILRIAGVYTNQCQSIPIANQIQRIYEKRLTAHVFPGDTSHGQPFIHLDDLVEAIGLAVQARHQIKSVETILIGEPETYSYELLQKEIAYLIHGQADWQTLRIPKVVAKTGAWVQDKIPGMEEPFIKPWMIDLADDHCQLDISRAEKFLGWTPKHRLIQSLPKMIEILQNDPNGWFKLNHLKTSSLHETVSGT